jgi:hypothetical protein
MDEMDRLLSDLPREAVPPELAASVHLAVRRRHRRSLVVRRAAASVLAALGVWLLWPGVAWASANELLAPGTSWLIGGLDSLNAESLDLLGRLWSGTLSLQGAVGSSLGISIVLGALLVCCSIFLAVDRASWQAVSGPRSRPAGRAMSPSGIHI